MASKGGQESIDRCCAWGCCQYPNGPFQVIVAQLLLFAGMWLSAGALGDCHFVSTRQVEFPPDLGIPELFEDPDDDSRRGVGFFFWELHDSGKCSWELFDTSLSDDALEDIWRWYFEEVLDSQWDAARIMAGMAWFLAFVTWWIILFATCTSYARPFRYVIAFVLMVVITTLQCCAYIVFRSNICSDRDGGCEMGRGAWYCFGAVLAYFISACCFIAMNDYPGAPPSDDDEEPAVMVVEAAELDKPEEEGADPEEDAADGEVAEEEVGADGDVEEEGATPDSNADASQGMEPENAGPEVEDPNVGEPTQSISK